jgi:DNA-binding LacI/PurR family transcriptional regulator
LKRFNSAFSTLSSDLGAEVGRTTIKDVSERAGVSVGTVSNVLNAPHRVAPQTRERVLQVVSELGYRPNRAARGLQARRTYLIGYLLPERETNVNTALDSFLHELVSTASPHGLEVVLFAPRTGQTGLEGYRDLIRRGDVDGFVLSETNYDDERIALLSRSGFPFVSFGRSLAEDPFAWVDVDGASGIADAVRHLLGAGHRRIALVAWPEGSESGDDRVAGYRRALTRAGVAANPLLEVRCLNGVDQGREAWRRLSLMDSPPTAVVAVQDQLAIGVVLQAQAMGLRPGVDLAVTGFDDTPAGALLGLSSVRQPLREVCRLLVEHLVRRIEDPWADPGHDLVRPELVIRSSSGADVINAPQPRAGSELHRYRRRHRR